MSSPRRIALTRFSASSSTSDRSVGIGGVPTGAAHRSPIRPDGRHVRLCYSRASRPSRRRSGGHFAAPEFRGSPNVSALGRIPGGRGSECRASARIANLSTARGPAYIRARFRRPMTVGSARDTTDSLVRSTKPPSNVPLRSARLVKIRRRLVAWRHCHGRRTPRRTHLRRASCSGRVSSCAHSATPCVLLTTALQVRKQVLASHGAIGVSLIAQPAHKTYWTLSAWTDQDALDSFVRTMPHLDVMRRFHDRLEHTTFTTWSVPADDLPKARSHAKELWRSARGTTGHDGGMTAGAVLAGARRTVEPMPPALELGTAPLPARWPLVGRRHQLDRVAAVLADNTMRGVLVHGTAVSERPDWRTNPSRSRPRRAERRPCGTSTASPDVAGSLIPLLPVAVVEQRFDPAALHSTVGRISRCGRSQTVRLARRRRAASRSRIGDAARPVARRQRGVPHGNRSHRRIRSGRDGGAIATRSRAAHRPGEPAA